MGKGLAVTANKARPMLSLGDGIVPVFYPTPLAKEDVNVVGDITRGENARLFCFQIFIHGDAVWDDEAAVCEELGDMRRSNAGNDHFAGNFSSTRQHRSAHPVFAEKSRHWRD